MTRTRIALFALCLGIVVSGFQLVVCGQQVPATSPVETARSESGNPPLIEAFYQASRQDDGKASSRYLDQAKELISRGAEVKAKGAFGRTALHWAVIGAIYADEEKHRQALVELAETLLDRQAPVNAEDDYGNTPLDYQEVSPHDEILYLLLEHGARNGDSQNTPERLRRLMDDLSSAAKAGDLKRLREALTFDLPVGAELQIRLTTGVGSHTSRSGDPIEAVITAPVIVAGRQVIGPRTKIQGTVMLAQKAANAYQRSQLVLDFPNLVHPSGAKTRLVTGLTLVDNAKETVQAGRIIGLPHPQHTKLNWGIRRLGVTDPILADVFQAGIFLRDKEYKREIAYDPGVDITLTLLDPAKLVEAAPGATWPTIAPSPTLIQLVRAQPLRTKTSGGTPSDLTNLLFIGSREKIESAFKAAGWEEAEKIGLRSGLETFVAVAEGKGYEQAHVSLLLLEGAKPDLVFQKQNNTFAKRHHIRVWKRPSYEGQDVWVAAATHDIGIAVHREGAQWVHRIDPKIDRERTRVTNDLLFTAQAKGGGLVGRPAAPRQSQNATGDKLETDGKIEVLIFGNVP
jgi:hypothetical protein